jgi:hypothetical protein
MSSTGVKGSHQTNTETEKGFKYKELKSAEVCPGLAHRTVRCATGQCPVHQGLQLRTAHLREFWRPLRYKSPDCPVAHRTVRCASGATATSTPTVACNSIQCATVRVDVRLVPEGAPDSLQDLSGAPPDYPVAQKTEAPTVRIQRPADVVGAPDCPVRHVTDSLPTATFGGWGYKYPNLPTIHCNQVFQPPTPYKSYSIQYKTQQRDQILSQVHSSFQIK